MVRSMRRIIHIDMDAFFASVEELDNPAIRGLPVIVGGHQTKRGVVSAASYPARRFGVHAAMPLWQAHQLCPQAVFLPVRMDRYAKVSHGFQRILLEYTPLVEPLGFDEAFLDVTGSEHLFGPAEAIGHAIQERVEKEIGLSASIGISYNKFLAKIASGWKKPYGFTVILEEAALDFLDELPLDELPSVGYRTRERLERFGLRKVCDLKTVPCAILEDEFGALASELLSFAKGIDPRQVTPAYERKSMGEEATFSEDLSDLQQLLRVLLEISDRLARHLRAEGFCSGRVSIKVRYPNFITITRTQSLRKSTDCADQIYQAASGLLQRADPKRVRLLGIHLSSLTREREGMLFPDRREERQEHLGRALDRIEDKYGTSTINRAALFSPKANGKPANAEAGRSKKAPRHGQVCGPGDLFAEPEATPKK